MAMVGLDAESISHRTGKRSGKKENPRPWEAGVSITVQEEAWQLAGEDVTRAASWCWRRPGMGTYRCTPECHWICPKTCVQRLWTFFPWWSGRDAAVCGELTWSFTLHFNTAVDVDESTADERMEQKGECCVACVGERERHNVWNTRLGRLYWHWNRVKGVLVRKIKLRLC